MKGDQVHVVVETGEGAKEFWFRATKAGRRIEIVGPVRGVLEVQEVTRNGDPVRTGRFMAARVISAVEYPFEPGKLITVTVPGSTGTNG